MSSDVLPAEVAKRVRNLTFQARRAVEGLLSGVHRSPHRGASVVFVEHRDYRPGDDLRLVDWRAFARTDKDVIKRFEQETQLRATLVLDRSGSMSYGGERGDAKDLYGASILAALAYVLIGQGDAVGTAAVADHVDQILPPRTRPAHLDSVLTALGMSASRGRRTDLATSLRQIAERIGRRGVVAIASDLLDFGPHALEPLAHLVARGHDVMVFHIVHPDEEDFPFDGPVRFKGLENEESMDVDASALRRGYRREMADFVESCRRRCTASGARYVLARTDRPVEHALSSALRGTRRRGWRGGRS